MSKNNKKNKTKYGYLLELRKVKHKTDEYGLPTYNTTRDVIGVFKDIKDVKKYIKKDGIHWIRSRKHFFAILELSADGDASCKYLSPVCIKCIDVNGRQIDQFEKFWKTKK